MPTHNKLTVTQAVARSKSKHGDRFTYEFAEYNGIHGLFKVTCKKHGNLNITFANHMRGYGCPECAKQPNSNKRNKAANEFLGKAAELLGENYDLSEVVYGKNQKEKVKITCKTHGPFWMSPVEVLVGQKCPKCSRQNQADFHRMTREEFIARASARFDNKYDYSLVEYTVSGAKVKIICPHHGVFEQSPNLHFSTHGCGECSKMIVGAKKTASRAATFVDDATKVHGDLYDLSKVVYRGKDRAVTVGCREHGDFEIKPHNLLSGSGCKRCAKFGYRPNRAGSLYVLRDSEITTKIGITNNKPQDRADRVSSGAGKNFTVLHDFRFEDGAIPDAIETALLREMRGQYKQPVEKYQGSTECFLDVDHTKLLERIQQLIQEHTDAQQQ